MIAHVRCRHCGAVIVSSGCSSDRLSDELFERLVALTKDATINSAILRVLTRHFSQNGPTERIVDAVYGSTPPLTVDNTIRVHISALRHVVRPLGLVIVNERYPCMYRLDHGPAP